MTPIQACVRHYRAVVLNCLSLMVCDVYLFMCLFGSLFVFENCVFRPSAHFFKPCCLFFGVELYEYDIYKYILCVLT